MPFVLSTTVRTPLVAGHRAELEDLRMDRGLAAGEHHDLRFSLGGDERVEAGGDLLDGQCETIALVAGVGEAHWTVEVAGRVDLDYPQTGVLLVIGTQPAVQRAAVAHLGLKLNRQRTGLVEPLGVHVQLGVAVHERHEAAVIAAPLAQVHLVVTHVDLGVDDRLADRADALGVLHEHLVAVDPGRHRSTSLHTASHSLPDIVVLHRTETGSAPTTASHCE
jgi:hypothetical protein